MLDSTPLAATAIASDIFIEADSANADAVWARVEQEIAAGRHVWLAGTLVEPLARRFGVAHDGRTWIEIAPHSNTGGGVNRLRDLVLSGIALIVLLPVFAVFALLVKFSSPGPALYATTVIGRGRRPFIWRKFRSMRVIQPQDDEAQRRNRFRAFAAGTHQGKVVDDRRVTRVGAFLRKYSLDELPQLWNVFKGDMSLVGPRPCLPYEAEMFPMWAGRRFNVPPGLTGVWQVVGRSRVGLDAGLAMDVYYTYMRSFEFDVRLMLQTIRVMLRGEGGK